MIEKIKNWICPARMELKKRNLQLIKAAEKYEKCKAELIRLRTEAIEAQIEIELLKQPVW